MAVNDKVQKRIVDPSESWQDRTGQEVEDFVCRHLIIDGEYDVDAQELHLKREGNEDIIFPVTVQAPTYIYGIIVYGIRLDGKVYTTKDLLMQYRSGRKVELGIAIRSVAERSGKQSTVTKPFDVKIDMVNDNKTVRQSINAEVYPTSHEYFQMEGTNLVLNIPDGANVSDIIAWVDVTEMFTKSFKNYTFAASFEQVTENVNRTYSHTLDMNIVNEVINLIYSGEVITNNNYIEMAFDPSSTDKTKYKLVIFNGEYKTENSPGDMKIANLNPGLNQIQVKAINIQNSDIYTDWCYIDIIYSEGITDTIVAVNGVSKDITNNGVATLYELTVYSPKSEEISITTYLDDVEPDYYNPNPTNIIKSEVIDPSQYNIENNSLVSIYKKYIEINSDNAVKFLLIKIGNDFYKFYTPYEMEGTYYTDPYVFKRLNVEDIIEEYTYVKSYPTGYNFDQITGYINNVFVTKQYSNSPELVNISESLESSDGWKENEGRVYFKVSAQNAPIFKNPLNLNLGTNFTLELGIKSYNVSNIDNPVLTLGKLQLRPTMICWNVDRNAYTDDAKGFEAYRSAFLKRVSKFQEGVETHITITVDSNWTVKKSNDLNQIYYPDFLGDNQSVFDKSAANYTHNLMRIYINGVIDREVFLENSEVSELRNALLQINPTSSDVDFYLFRVYNNNSLRFDEVVRNYVAFLPEKTGRNSKEDVYTKNDILDDFGVISWEKCYSKFNTLLFVFPAGGKFPNRFWGGQDGNAEEDVNKKLWTSLFINYADPITNVKYGGRLNKLQVKGQGSSAMRYLIWNVNSSLNKFKDANDKKIKSEFTPNGLLNPRSIPEDYTGVEALSVTKGSYVMPMYENKVDKTEYGYTKMVGKVNYASSMQSHKIGACKLYDDAFKATIKGSLPSGGLKAVHEEPFLYFYIESDLSNEQCADLSWEDLLTMTDKIKFMGFQTWGPGKGDDTCSGYDEDKTPEYLMLEGGENGDNSVNFLVPWHSLQRLNKIPGQENISYVDLEKQPVCSKEKSLSNPEANLLIDDESIVYLESGAWDIDYGIEEVEAKKTEGVNVDYFKFADGVIKSPGGNSKSSLQWFREFYDFVYKYDFTFIVEESSVTQPKADWDTTKKHLIIANSFKPDGISNLSSHIPYDVYRYDRVNNSWVPAGLYYDIDKAQWERLNYREMSELSGVTNSSQHALLRRALVNYFKRNIGNYVDINDISFHQAFIKFLSGTDNRAKNTYFQIIGPIYEEVGKIDDEGNPILNEDGKQETEFVIPSEDKRDYKIRLIGDDLDTILATDNNGLQSKDYNLVEDSYDENYNSTWGDLGNIFFRMYDICFEDDIKNKLTGIITTSGLTAASVNNTGTYFYNTFFKVQEDFPAIAYNHTAKIYYENAAIIKEVGQKATEKYTFEYKHNDVEPIEQSHGSSLECERQFMKERMAYLAGYANAGLDGYVSTGRSGGSGTALKLQIDFTPFQDFYPIYQFGTSVNAGYTPFGYLQTHGTHTDTWTGNTYNGVTASLEDLQKSSNTRRRVALKDKEYSVKFDSGATEAINQGLYQMNMYKSLSITGLTVPDLSGSFDRATLFEIDNNKLNDDYFKDWSKFTMNSNNAQLPVVQTLNLKQIVLPDTLSLLNYHKLQTLDLTGSTTNYVEFPQTGNLKNVILPSSITEFRIYNNPGLESVQIVTVSTDQNKNVFIEEDLSNLKTVYIDCNKCGVFDVADFCEKLTRVSSLEEITLVNASNLKMTESTISTLASLKCRFTGTFHIVDDIKIDNPTTVAISFATKEQLVNKFGIITDTENDVYINYQSKDIYADNVSCSEIIHLYLNSDETEAEFQNAFGLTISEGNNVAILSEQNPFDNSLVGRLNITYSITSASGVSTIDSKTGIITITGTSTEEDVINITIITDNGTKISKSCKLICSWVAPEIGDFAYADGSFSSAYNPSKTLVGLVYHKDSTGSGDQETGTAYIIGKEYTTDSALFAGVSYYGANIDATNDTARDISKLETLLGKAQLSGYDNVTEVSNTMNGVPGILPGNITNIKNLNKVGKQDTIKYVEHVKQFLQKIRDTKYNVNFNKNTLYIESLDNLISLQNSLTADNFLSEYDDTATNDYTLSNIEYNKALLYPYFYSMYLYEPAIKETEELDPQYAKTNWYAPSVGELSLALYCRAMSISNNFSAANLMSNVNTKADNEYAIFSKAFAKTGTISVWQNLFSSGNNLITNVNSSTRNNYGYSVYTDYNNVVQAGWVSGLPGYEVTGNWDNNTTVNNSSKIWRLNTHYGIPFTQYNYAKPNA